MSTLTDRLLVAARAAESRPGGPSGRERGVTFVVGGREDHVPWMQLQNDAQGAAGALAARGLGQGSHIAVLGPTTRAHVTLIEAVWLAGATLVVLPLPMRLASIDEFVQQTRRRIAQADIALVLVDPDFAAFVQTEPGDAPMLTYDQLGTARYTAPHVDPDSLAVLQFTSGSTADPKGVMLPHRTVCANLDAIAHAAAIDCDTDVMVSWLPLYHDMGLIGFLMLPMSIGCSLVLGAPQDFLGAPLRWMQWISQYRGTVTAGPNFAWVLATRALRGCPRLDLSCVRVALNGAEPVDASAVERFIDAAAPHGFAPAAVFPAFGMAELVIGGAFPQPGRGLRVDHVRRDRLERDGVAESVVRIDGDKERDSTNTRTFVTLGRAVPGLELRVVDRATNEVLADRMVGELQIRGSSVTPGYYKRPDANRALFDGEWLRTGDLAYLVDGELVICGRIKDVIIVGGRNVFPDEIERAAGVVDGVRAGNVVAFGVSGRSGKEGVVVVAEVRTDDPTIVRRLVVERVRDTCGVPPKDVVFVEPGTLPKTSSGKLQRNACRERYLAGAY